MYTGSCAHIVDYSCLCDKFMGVDSAVVPQADILLLKQNIGNWDTENYNGKLHIRKMDAKKYSNMLAVYRNTTQLKGMATACTCYVIWLISL